MKNHYKNWSITKNLESTFEEIAQSWGKELKVIFNWNHNYIPDKKNHDIFININGTLLRRND